VAATVTILRILGNELTVTTVVAGRAGAHVRSPFYALRDAFRYGAESGAPVIQEGVSMAWAYHFHAVKDRFAIRKNGKNAGYNAGYLAVRAKGSRNRRGRVPRLSSVRVIARAEVSRHLRG
jgi:hypothetical protein